ARGGRPSRRSAGGDRPPVGMRRATTRRTVAMNPHAFRCIAAAALAAAAAALFAPPVAAQIVVTADLEEVCAQPPVTHRRTVAYVDLTAVDPNELEWGLTLLNRLELAPREWLTVLAVNAID